MAQLRVGAAAHRLDVKVSTPQQQYRVREKVMTTVRVSHLGRPLANAEVAFAAVDEGLLALAGNKSWDRRPLLRERPGSAGDRHRGERGDRSLPLRPQGVAAGRRWRKRNPTRTSSTRCCCGAAACSSTPTAKRASRCR
ncbi:MAG: hypothetical protein U1F49_00575 [Rubrivivax sp.]